MISFQNSLVTLTYFTNSDSLLVTWSSDQVYSALELQNSMHKVIEVIAKYNCRNLVIDASKAITLLDDTSFRTSLAGFMAELGKTGIQKLARIFTPYPAREEKFDFLQDELSIPFQIRDFSNVENALQWLSTGKK